MFKWEKDALFAVQVKKDIVFFERFFEDGIK